MKPFVGEIVHLHWRARCHAAIIDDFWEDDDAAHLFVFERNGMAPIHRAVRGKAGQDQRWHRLNECPDMGSEANGSGPATIGDVEPVGSISTSAVRATPPTDAPRRRGRKPGSRNRPKPVGV